MIGRLMAAGVAVVVVAAILVPAIAGADWLSRQVAARPDVSAPTGHGSTVEDEVLGTQVRATSLFDLVVSPPLLESSGGGAALLEGGSGSGPTGPGEVPDALPPGSTTSSTPSTTVQTTTTTVGATTTTSVIVTSTTVPPSSTTTSPTTTTTCRGNSGGNGKGNNC